MISMTTGKRELIVEIGAFVRSERKRLGWTQQELANRAGVGLNFVYQLEKNKPTVQLNSVNQVLLALGFRVGVMRDFRPWQQNAADQGQL